jgi:hypothetical protein
METRTNQTEEKLVETQLLARRAQFALGLSTLVTIADIIIGIGSVGLWLFFRQYTQLLALGGATILLFAGSASFPVLHRQGRTTLGFYNLLVSSSWCYLPAL